MGYAPFPLRVGFPPDMPYSRTAILASKRIAEVPDPQDLVGLPADEVERLHRRQIAKKNFDLHAVGHHLPAPVRYDFAAEIIDAWLDPAVVDELVDRTVQHGIPDADGRLRVKVLPPIKASFNNNINFLCYAYTALLCQALQATGAAEFCVSPNLVLTAYAGTRTESGAIGRVARQSMQVAFVAPGANVIITDDHAEAGSITAVAYDAVARARANLIGISVLSAIPDARNIRVAPRLAAALGELAGDVERLDAALRPAGLSLATLTNREALLTYAFLADPEDALFAELLGLVGYDHGVVEGQYGSLIGAFEAPAMTLGELALAVEREATGNRIELVLPGQVLSARPEMSAEAFIEELRQDAPNLFTKGPDYPGYPGLDQSALANRSRPKKPQSSTAFVRPPVSGGRRRAKRAKPGANGGGSERSERCGGSPSPLPPPPGSEATEER